MRPWLTHLLVAAFAVGSTLIGGVFLAGCGKAPKAAASCELAGLPSNATVTGGGRLVLRLTTAPAGGTVALGTLPAGWRQSSGADGAVILKVPYGSTSPVTLTLTQTCGSTSGQSALTVAVKPLTWATVGPWAAGSDGPSAREYPAMWIDDLHPDTLWMYGGLLYVPMQDTRTQELWTLDLPTGKWTQPTPVNPPLLSAGARVANVPGSPEVLYNGGIDASNSAHYGLSRFNGSLTAPTFSDEPISSGQTAEAGSYTGAFVYDAKRDRYLSVCGAGDLPGVNCNVWSYAAAAGGGTWSLLVPSTTDGPTPRYGFFYGYDAETDRVIVAFGDTGQDAANGTGAMRQDTWALELANDPPTWTQISAGETPAIGRRNGAYVLDPLGHRLFTWGGTPDGATTLQGLYALDLDLGHEAWQKVDTANAPPDRTSAIGVYDAPRTRLLMGFGNDTHAYADLWALDVGPKQ